MPYKGPVVCLKCEATESSFWTNAENLGVICLDCVTQAKKDKEAEEAGESKEEEEEKPGGKKKTRAAKTYKTRHNPTATPKQPTAAKTKGVGKGRRSLLKKVAQKAPTQTATVVTKDYVFHDGTYFQTGDIVAIQDDNNDTYYAQIIGLMTDQYCKHSCVIQWLLPSTESPNPNQEFDPATYILGPEEELPRDIEFFDFVMHAPSDYYKSKKTPYVPVGPSDASGYIWTSMDPVRRNK